MSGTKEPKDIKSVIISFKVKKSDLIWEINIET